MRIINFYFLRKKKLSPWLIRRSKSKFINSQSNKLIKFRPTSSDSLAFNIWRSSLFLFLYFCFEKKNFSLTRLCCCEWRLGRTKVKGFQTLSKKLMICGSDKVTYREKNVSKIINAEWLYKEIAGTPSVFVLEASFISVVKKIGWPGSI